MLPVAVESEEVTSGHLQCREEAVMEAVTEEAMEVTEGVEWDFRSYSPFSDLEGEAFLDF